MRKKILSIVVSIVFMVGIFIAGGTKGEAKGIKLGTCLGSEELWKGGPAHPFHYVGNHMTKRLAELTKGELTAKFYPKCQLGGDREMLESVMGGTLEMAFIASTPMAMFLKELGVFNLPLQWKGYADPQEIFNVLDGPFGDWLNMKALKKGFRIAGIGLTGTCVIFTRDKRIDKIEDLKGLKIRTMQAPMDMAMMNALGARATPMPWPEVYMALSQGVIDGVLTETIASVSAKLHEQYKYVCNSEMYMLLRVVVVSEKWFQTLSPGLQLKVLQVGNEGAQMLRYTPQKLVGKIFDYYKKIGITVTNPPREPFVKATAAARKEFWKKVGGEEVVKFAEFAKVPPKLPRIADLE
jgi:tripartite ATP-independent transporter DctP family solute receptor